MGAARNQDPSGRTGTWFKQECGHLRQYRDCPPPLKSVQWCRECGVSRQLVERVHVWRVKCGGKHCSVSRTFAEGATLTAQTIATSHALRMGHVVRVWCTTNMEVVEYGKVADENPLF